MLNFVRGSKYRAETISIVLSFSDVMLPGDTITGIPVITPTVATGSDPTPSDILYEGVTIINGIAIEQRFRLGVVGTIYQINFSISTVAGDTFDKECYLAILPDDDQAVPNYLPIFETSTLYPYYLSENLHASLLWIGGKLLGIYTIDSMKSSLSIFQASLYGTRTQYTIPNEGLTNAIGWINGFLSGTPITYTVTADSITNGIAWISGALYGTSVSYRVPNENLQSVIAWTSGSII